MPSEIQKAFEEKAFGKPTIVPRFFEHAKKDSLRTVAYGMNIYTSSTYVEIKTKGRRDTTTRQATEEDKALFDHHYSRYAQSIEYNTVPMEALAGYSVANLFTLRDLGVTTVEELADYTGQLPLASLKLMQHCAVHMVQQMQVYQPPNFTDDKMEVPRETLQTQRQILRTGEGFSPSDGEAGNNGSGVQQLGVRLDEAGNIIELHGQKISEEGNFQEEKGREEKVQKVIHFY